MNKFLLHLGVHQLLKFEGAKGNYLYDRFFNQACADLEPTRTWFLRIASVREHLYACVCVYLHVCPPLRLLINSGVMWCYI